tara:strand:+ start:2408 stop:2833 length:426 start_codon:yes stop_codon:yes gene_type:complete
MTNKLFTRTVITLISSGMLFMSNTVFALWSMEVTNNSSIPISVVRPVPANSSLTKVGTLGNGAVAIPGRGVVKMTDIAHNDNPCGRPHWGVQIDYNGSIKRFYYDGGGKLGITIDDKGAASFKALSGGSQIVNGTNPPRCR